MRISDWSSDVCSSDLLLRDVEVGFEQRTTLIVGRNNSGKTSIAELFRRLLSGGSLAFRLEDFSLGCHESFWQALQTYRSEERRVGKECVSTCRSRWSPHR